MEPNHPYALNNLGVLNMIQKMPDKAIALFQRAITLKSDYVHPYYNLACIYAQQNKVEESLRYLQKAIALKPDINEWAAKDDDFKNLHHHPAFKKLLGKQAPQ
jgi:tetratricopeptide (TPR) repeat protein